MQCKEWDDANSELFKESHDEAVHKNSYKSRLYELISASLVVAIIALSKKYQLKKAIQWLGRLLSNSKNYERAVSSPGCQLSLSMLIIPQKMEKTKLR